MRVQRVAGGGGSCFFVEFRPGQPWVNRNNHLSVTRVGLARNCGSAGCPTQWGFDSARLAVEPWPAKGNFEAARWSCDPRRRQIACRHYGNNARASPPAIPCSLHAASPASCETLGGLSLYQRRLHSPASNATGPVSVCLIAGRQAIDHGLPRWPFRRTERQSLSMCARAGVYVARRCVEAAYCRRLRSAMGRFGGVLWRKVALPWRWGGRLGASPNMVMR